MTSFPFPVRSLLEAGYFSAIEGIRQSPLSEIGCPPDSVNTDAGRAYRVSETSTTNERFLASGS